MECDLQTALRQEMSEEDWFLYWGMTVGAIEKFNETELVLFLSQFLNFPLRSNRTTECTGKSLPISVLQIQSAVILLSLELWIQRHEPQTPIFVEKIKELWVHGCCISATENENLFYAFLEFPQEMLPLANEADYQKAFEDIKFDYMNDGRKSMVANIASFEET